MIMLRTATRSSLIQKTLSPITWRFRVPRPCATASVVGPNSTLATRGADARVADFVALADGDGDDAAPPTVAEGSGTCERSVALEEHAVAASTIVLAATSNMRAELPDNVVVRRLDLAIERVRRTSAETVAASSAR